MLPVLVSEKLNLILAPSLSQFLILAAAAKQLGYDSEKLVVILNSFRVNESNRIAVRIGAEQLGMRYLGEMSSEKLQLPVDYLEVIRRGLPGWIWDPAGVWRERVREIWPVLKGHVFETLFMPIIEDLRLWYILAGVQPRTSVFCADGIVPSVQGWHVRGFHWRGMPSELRRYPSPLKIYCPPFLEAEVKKIGHPATLMPEMSEDVRQRIAQNAHIQDGIGVLRERKPASCIVSQHLSTDGHMTPAAEISYYARLIKALYRRFGSPVFWKNHPRDEPDKLLQLQQHAGISPEEVISLPEHDGIPIEILLEDDQVRGNLKLTVCALSTLLLSLRERSIKTCAVSSPSFTARYERKLGEFCARYRLEHLTLNELEGGEG